MYRRDIDMYLYLQSGESIEKMFFIVQYYYIIKIHISISARRGWNIGGISDFMIFAFFIYFFFFAVLFSSLLSDLSITTPE